MNKNIQETHSTGLSSRLGSRLAGQPLPSRWRRFKRWAERHEPVRLDPEQLKRMVAMERLGRA